MKKNNLTKWEKVYRSHVPCPWEAAELPIEALLQFRSRLPPFPKILDFGCGTGRITRTLESWNAMVIGADCSPTAIARALPLKRGTYIVSESLSEFCGQNFDGLILWGVLHHYAPKVWGMWLCNASKAIRKNGVILIGNFDIRDIKFKGRQVRISQTTGEYCFADDHATLPKLLAEFFASIDSSGVLGLLDGPELRLRRTWRYYICTR